MTRAHRVCIASALTITALPACANDPDASADTDLADTTETAGGSEESTGADVEAEVTYWRDVKPILDARCGACHTADGVAPFAFDSYADAAVYAPAMTAAVESGSMPPWPASGDCNEYLHDPSLDDAQIDTLVAWVALGAPEGDPSQPGASLPVVQVELPRVDFEIAMAKEHTPQVASGGFDEHRCFLLDWPETEPVFVTGYEVVPGNRKVVHHLVARVAGPDEIAALEDDDANDAAYGWDCGAGTGMTGGGGPLLGAWVPGLGASVFPEGTGIAIEVGSKVLLNMHYNIASGDAGADLTRVAFMVEDEVESEGTSVFVSDPTWPIGDNMLIEAGDDHSAHTFDFEMPLGAVLVHSVGLHMHGLGAAGSLLVDHADGTQSCGLDIPRWDFNWQLGYRLAEPIRVAAGDRVQIQCIYDNSAANQPIIDGVPRIPTNVTWGEDSYDEMCIGSVYVTRD